jgi:hypothetical protein
VLIGEGRRASRDLNQEEQRKTEQKNRDATRSAIVETCFKPSPPGATGRLPDDFAPAAGIGWFCGTLRDHHNRRFSLTSS